ncbi:MAG: cyclase family protein [Candidatus Taylorbacteria bacterium]|nr:cyclase family protein [Candidatus Taylorbacteria bacterium]
MKLIDLTYELSESVPSWDNHADFALSTVTDYHDCTVPDLFRIQKINAGLSLGTHMDAPAHCIPDGRTIEELKLKELVADCVVIDVSREADEKYLILPSAILKFEKKHGEIPAHSLVIFYTGWSKHWDNPEKYHNNHAFPSVDVSAADMLVKRGIVGIGIDTFSCDTGKGGFPVHRVILGADKYLVENVANADALPPTGAKVFVLPLKIKDAAEAPVRLIALV